MKFVSSVICGAMCAFGVAVAQAAIVTYSFSGTVNSVNSGASGFLPSLAGVAPGDTFNGTLTYEAATAPSPNPFPGTFASATLYQPSSASFSVTIDGVTLNTWTGPHSAFVWNDEVTIGGCCNDGLIFTNIASINTTQYQLGNLLLPTGVLGSDALPGGPIVGGYAFDLRSAGAGTAFLSGTLTGGLQVSTVPLPAAAWLFGAGAMSLLGCARRRR